MMFLLVCIFMGLLGVEETGIHCFIYTLLYSCFGGCKPGDDEIMLWVTQAKMLVLGLQRWKSDSSSFLDKCNAHQRKVHIHHYPTSLLRSACPL
jgi:hypothetical protein